MSDTHTAGVPAVRDVATLAALVAEFQVDGLPLTVEPEAADAVRASLDATGLVLLGEVHGVRETPQLLLALMRELGIGGLALEWSVSAAASVTAWCDGGPLPEDEGLWSGDGRVTAGHYALLRTLPGAGEPRVALVDVAVLPADATGSDRDAAMATAVLGVPVVDGGRLVVAGNAHTGLVATELGEPMGVHVARARPGVRSIAVDYLSGAYYNFAPARFAPRGAARQGPYRLHLDDGRLALDVARAHEADVPHRTSGPG
jgi:hypothetical protein